MNRKLNGTIALLAMILMLFAFTGCSDDDDGGTGPTPTPDHFDVVAAAGDAYFTSYKIDVDGDGTRETGVNIAASATLAANLSNYYIIDYRSSTDYGYAHIPGAHNLALSSLVSEIDNLPTDQVILNVCYTGQTASFATSVINLIGTQTGHKAINLKFGFSEWAPLEMVNAAGTFAYPTDDALDSVMEATDYPMLSATDFPTFDTGLTDPVEILKARAEIAIARWGDGSVKAATDAVYPLTANWYLINYFSDAAYAAGHLPNAVQYAPPTATTPSDFVSTAALNTLPTDRPIAIYCYTGQTSAQAAAYLSMLGYDAKTVLFGVQKMCYSNSAINTVPWHEADSDYPLEGTGVMTK